MKYRESVFSENLESIKSSIRCVLFTQETPEDEKRFDQHLGDILSYCRKLRKTIKEEMLKKGARNES